MSGLPGMCLAAALLATAPAPLVPAASPTGAAESNAGFVGYWQFVKSGEIVEISACGDRYCGRVAATAPSDRGARDARNPDRRLTQRSICGLQLFRLRAENGRARLIGPTYSPEDGLTYRLTVTRTGEGLIFSAMPQPPDGQFGALGPSRPTILELRRTSDPGPCAADDMVPG